MKISAIMPTCNRPSNLIRLFDSVIETIADKDNFEFALRLDNGDDESVAAIDKYRGRLNFVFCVGDKAKKHGTYWNDAWKIATGEIYMMLGDDFVFHNKGWDDEVRKEFLKYEDRILFLFGEDGIQHGDIGTHAFIHKNWTDALGYFASMEFNVYYHDTWNDDISRRVGRRVYRPDLFFEHMHHDKGAPYDDVYKNMMAKTGNDRQIWESTGEKREEEANKLRRIMK